MRQGGIIKGLMGVVVILIMGAFAFTSTGPTVGVDNQECVVEVEGSCVEPKDYHMLLRLVAPPGTTDKQLRKAGFSDYAVNALVERELLLREARRLGISISEQQLDDELALGRVHFSWPVEAPMPQAVAQGYPFPITGATELVTYIRVRNTKTDAFDYQVYTRQIQNLLRMSPREFKERQENEIVAARVRALVTSPVRVAEDEAFAAFERDKSQAVVRTVDVKKTWFERFVVDGSDAAAEAFAKNNAAQVDEAWAAVKDNWTGECPLASEILFSFSPGASAEERAEQQAKATEYKRLLDGGASFGALSRAVGMGPSARYGGAIGCLDAAKYGAGGEDLVKAVEPLAQGALSAVVETPRGFHVMRFLGKLPAAEAEKIGRLEVARRAAIESAATAAARSFTEKLLAKAKAGAELTAALDSLLPEQLSFEGLSAPMAETLAAAARLAKDAPEFEVSRPFSRTSSPLPGLKDRGVATRVFDLAEPDALIEEPLETFGGFAAIQLKEKDIATREQFDSEKVELIQALKEQKRAEALTNYMTSLRERAQQIVINPAYTSKAKEPEPSEDDGTSSG
jgi:peptidyl-prolyl cis-trans isomerase D